MTDLHAHILPGMDDGASDLKTAMKLLQLQQDQGVSRIALTSHYLCDKMQIEDFLSARDQAFACLQEELEEQNHQLEFRLGCEVYFSPRLLEMELRPLCMEGTDVMLLELPVRHQPHLLRELLFHLQTEGIIPLIAHVERYDYVYRDPRILAQWAEWGAYAQVNADSILGAQGKLVLDLIKWGLVHAVASDTHTLEKRRPNLEQAFRVITQRLGEETVARLERQALALFEGEEPTSERVHVPKRLGMWWV